MRFLYYDNLLSLMKIIIFLAVVIIFSMFIDSKTDYRKKFIRYYISTYNGVPYIRVPYLIWQSQKRKEIERRFSEHLDYGDRFYQVVIAFTHRKYTLGNSRLKRILYREYYAQLQLCQEDSPNIVINTQVQGDNNYVNVVQNINYNIYDSIDYLLDELQISNEDKYALELFKYKLKSDEVSQDDAKKLIDKLEKYSPYIAMANTLIGLIKTVYSLF